MEKVHVIFYFKSLGPLDFIHPLYMVVMLLHTCREQPIYIWWLNGEGNNQVVKRPRYRKGLHQLFPPTIKWQNSLCLRVH